MGKELVMYKNQLQEYAQQSGFPLPEYQTLNEGFTHAPKFRSSVVVNGRRFVSTKTCVHKRDSEQDVAKLTLDCILQNAQDHDTDSCQSILYKEVRYCKSIILEFATKKKLQVPEYRTIPTGDQGSVYVSSLTIDGKTCTGEIGKSKKEAEQLVARKAILLLLDTADSEILIPIIKSKDKLYHASLEHKDLSPAKKQGPSAQQFGQGKSPPANSNANLPSITLNMEGKRKLGHSNMAPKRIRS